MWLLTFKVFQVPNDIFLMQKEIEHDFLPGKAFFESVKPIGIHIEPGKLVQYFVE